MEEKLFFKKCFYNQSLGIVFLEMCEYWHSNLTWKYFFLSCASTGHKWVLGSIHLVILEQYCVYDISGVWAFMNFDHVYNIIFQILVTMVKINFQAKVTQFKTWQQMYKVVYFILQVSIPYILSNFIVYGGYNTNN